MEFEDGKQFSQSSSNFFQLGDQGINGMNRIFYFSEWRG